MECWQPTWLLTISRGPVDQIMEKTGRGLKKDHRGRRQGIEIDADCWAGKKSRRGEEYRRATEQLNQSPKVEWSRFDEGEGEKGPLKRQ